MGSIVAREDSTQGTRREVIKTLKRRENEGKKAVPSQESRGVALRKFSYIVQCKDLNKCGGGEDDTHRCNPNDSPSFPMKSSAALDIVREEKSCRALK